MKRQIFPFLLLLLAACQREADQREADLPEATSAAKEVYLQYAGRKDLTVAMIGDYQGYNAVMLQTQDAEGWLRLCEEFGVDKHVDAAALDSTRVSSLTVSHVKSHEGSDLQELKDLLGDDSVIVENILRSAPVNIRIDTALSFVRSEHWDNGVRQYSTVSFGTDVSRGDSALMRHTILHGHTGYIVHDDSDALTLWLFFYSNEDEKNQILNTITQ